MGDVLAMLEGFQSPDDATFESACREFGVLFRREDVAELLALRSYQVPLGRLLAVVEAAAKAPRGMAYEAIRGTRSGTVHAVAFAWVEADGRRRIALGARPGASVGAIWRKLAPWSKDLEKNRKRLAAWANECDDILRLEICKGAFEIRPGDREEEALLLARIVEAPDDDEPRTVYADWLLERGESHGEFIALQCEYARTDDLARKKEMKKRIHALRDRQWRRYAGVTTPYTNFTNLTRGFADTVQMTAREFARDGEKVFATHPVRRLVLKDEDGGLEELASTPALSRVRELVVTSRAGPLSALAASPHLGSLRSLMLAEFALSRAGWKSFFEALRAPLLEAFALRNAPSIGCFQALDETAFGDRLRAVEVIRWAHLGPEAGFGEAASLLAHRPNLKRVALADLSIADDCVGAFFDQGAMPTLESFAAIRHGTTATDVEPVASSERARALTFLDLGNVTEAGALTILRSPFLSGLRHVSLVVNPREGGLPNSVVGELLMRAPDSPLRSVALADPFRHPSFKHSHLGRKLAERYDLSEVCEL